jgi:hypothetical protein
MRIRGSCSSGRRQFFATGYHAEGHEAHCIVGLGESNGDTTHVGLFSSDAASPCASARSSPAARNRRTHRARPRRPRRRALRRRRRPRRRPPRRRVPLRPLPAPGTRTKARPFSTPTAHHATGRREPGAASVRRSKVRRAAKTRARRSPGSRIRSRRCPNCIRHRCQKRMLPTSLPTSSRSKQVRHF